MNESINIPLIIRLGRESGAIDFECYLSSIIIVFSQQSTLYEDINDLFIPILLKDHPIDYKKIIPITFLKAQKTKIHVGFFLQSDQNRSYLIESGYVELHLSDFFRKMPSAGTDYENIQHFVRQWNQESGMLESLKLLETKRQVFLQQVTDRLNQFFLHQPL